MVHIFFKKEKNEKKDVYIYIYVCVLVCIKNKYVSEHMNYILHKTTNGQRTL